MALSAGRDSHSTTKDEPCPPTSSPPPHTEIDIDAIIQMATRTSATSPTGKDTRTQLFVGNLPYRVRWQDLKDLFRKAGTVLRADVSLGPDNRSRGYGTVLLASAEDAGRAIDMFNGYSWQTRILEVRHDRIAPEFDMNYPLPSIHSYTSSLNIPMPPTSSASSIFPIQANPSLDHLRSNSMNSSISAPSLGAPLLNSAGPGASLLTPTSPTFVSMAAANHLASLTQTRSGSRTGGNMTMSPCGQGRNVFVGNLPFQCQWQDLKDLFRRAGSIVRADVALGPDGRSRGYGTVLFANEADADRAVAMFNGMEYNNRVLKVHHDKFTQSSSPPPYSTGLAPPQLQHHSSSSYFGNAAALIPSSSTSSSLLSSNSAMTGSTNSPFRTTFAHNSSQPPSPFDPYPPQLQHNAYSAPLPTATVTQPTTYQDLLAQWSTAVSAPPAPQAHNNQLLQHQIETLHHPTVVERLVPVPPVPSPLLSKSRNSQSSSVSSPPPSTRLDLLPPSSIGAGIQAEKRDKDFGLLRMHSDELLRALQQPAAPSMKTSNSDDSGAAIKSKVMTTPSKRMTRSPSGPGSAHPGPITLPPPPFSPPKPKENDSPSLVEQVDGDPSTMSPLARGLPPMTPSMPGFTFYPQTATPPLYAHYLSPGIGQFSPPPRDAGAIGGSSNGPNASPFYPSNQGYAYNPHNGGLMMAMFGMHSPPLPVTTPSAPGGNNVGMLSPGGIVPVPMTPGVPMTPQQAGGPGGNPRGIPMTPGHPIHPRMYRPPSNTAGGYGELGSPSRGIGVYPAQGPSGGEGYFPPVVPPEEGNEYFPPVMDERDSEEGGNGLRRSSVGSSVTTAGGGERSSGSRSGSGSGSGTGTTLHSSVEGGSDDVNVEDSDRENVSPSGETNDSKMVSPPETPSASMMRTSSAGSGGGLSGSGVRQGSGKWMSQKKNVGMKLEGVGVARVGLLGLGDGLPVVSPGRRASFGDLRKHEFHPNVGDVTLDTSKEGGEIKQSSR